MRDRALGLRLTIGALLVATAATAGCSVLIGVSGDPVVVDEGGAGAIEPGGDSGDAGGADAVDGPVE